MKTPLLIAAIAAGMTLSATAEARDGRGDRLALPSFADLDANGDAGVTMAEVEAHMAAQVAARFVAADTDGDGALSADEMLARAEGARAERMAKRIASRIEAVDANGDGLLQIEEIGQVRGNERAGERGSKRAGRSFERLFERADANDDGTLSAEEYAVAAERLQNHRRNGGN